jgi:hypothetical protein
MISLPLENVLCSLITLVYNYFITQSFLYTVKFYVTVLLSTEYQIVQHCSVIGHICPVVKHKSAMRFVSFGIQHHVAHYNST